MFKTLLIASASILLITTSTVASETCWVASELKGYSTDGIDSFFKDGFAGREFIIRINGKKTSVTELEDFTFDEVTPNLIVGKYKVDKNAGVVVTIAINKENNEVFFTQTRNGFLLPDSAKVFVGKLKQKCK